MTQLRPLKTIDILYANKISISIIANLGAIVK